MNIETTINGLCELAPQFLSDFFNSDCCIAATKIAVGVLERSGFKAHPQPTQLRVWNPALWKRIVAEKDKFDATKFRDGEWSVGVGFGEDPRKQHEPGWKGFDGHLVAIVEDTYLLDLSFGQVSRPHKGMPTPPIMAIRFDKEWPVSHAGDDFTFCYEPIKNVAFLQSPDWTQAERTEWIITAILKEISKVTI